MADLAGLRVVVTRAAHQADELASPLREAGAEVILLPVIGIAPALDPLPLRQAAGRVNQFDWLVFTSANAIEYFAQSLSVSPSEVSAKVAAVGGPTAARAASLGFHVEMLPAANTAESLAAALTEMDLRDKRILIPSAAVTRDVLPSELARCGGRVEVVAAYRNVVPPGMGERAAEIFRLPLPDWVTFASPSAVNNLAGVVDREVLRQCKLASIGPVTSDALRVQGLEPAVEATPHTIPALVGAMASSNQNL